MIKYDDIVPYPAEVEAVAKAIKKAGKPILLSLSPGGNVPPNAIKSFQMAQMLRVTKDVWDQAHYLDDCFDAWRKWTGKETINFWIDMDMIPFGQLLMMSPKKAMLGTGDADAVRLAGNGYRRWQQFSQDQMFTFITLRALSASPLMVGGDLPTMDGFSLRLLTDPDMIACNQNGVMGHLVREQDNIEIWLTPQRDTNGKRGWIGVFNRGWSDVALPLTPELLGLGEVKPATIRDIWNGSRIWQLKDQAKLSVTIPADGVLFLRFE
jgi:hypothetical protein